MTEPRRLFDCLEYHLERAPLEDMLAAKENGQWRKYSTQQVSEISKQLAGGL
jgi:long-chain acyl-CoA synthetase